MIINYKISGFAAGAAFILSFLIGILSGVGIFAVLIRALVFAVVFFGISGGINLLVSRFLPELLEENDSDPGFEENLNGSRINILEEENGQEAIAYPQEAPEASGGELGDISVLTGDGAGKPNDSRKNAQVSTPAALSAMDQSSGDEYTEKETDNLFMDFPFQDSPIQGSSIQGSPMQDSPIQGSPIQGSPMQGSPIQGSFSDLQEDKPDGGSSPNAGASTDVLPDLDAIAGSFLSSSDDDDEEDTAASSPAAPVKRSIRGKSEGLAGDFNPKDIAEAIRTKLKREG